MGQWLRKRYDFFLSDKYRPQDVYIFATNLDRTISSASAVSAGLYPPTDNQIWNQNLLWLPIPIKTAPHECNTIIVHDRKCPRYEKLLKETKMSDYFLEINRNQSSIFELIKNHTGWIIEDIEPVKWLHCNFFLATETYNQNLRPSWAVEHKHAFERIAGLAFRRDSFTEAMQRFQTGPLFNYLISNFEQIISKNQTAPKFVMICAHDSSLIPALNAMGVYDNRPPPFGSAIIWELRRKANGERYINVFYKRNELEKLVVKNCEFDCDFNKFKDILNPISINMETWEQECNSNHDTKTNKLCSPADAVTSASDKTQ